jgi:DNA polymerase I-like protein with 3'-5' exonuclease and polymerase domains
MAAIEVYSGATITMWEEELYATPGCPFPTGPDVQVICYQAKAEGSCFAALGWRPPARVVDLFVERLRILNPTKWPSLLSTLAAYGLAGMSSEHKTLMRDAVIHRDDWPPELRKAITQYCLEDVMTTLRLMVAMDAADHIRWDQAEWRGTANFCWAYVENCGIPIDTATLRRLQEHREEIILALIAAVEEEHHFDVYRGTTLDERKFAALIDRLKIVDWPLTPTGKFSDSDETTELMAELYPNLAPFHKLKSQIDKLREIRLSIGDDGRNRFDFATFGTVTARCAPSTSENIMGGPKWMRGLIQAGPDHVLAVIDWVGQEYAIGAALSGDAAMQATYQNADIHMGTAIAADLAPPGATKETHPTARRIGKALNFCVMYGGGPPGLAAKLKSTKREATRFLTNTRQAFPDFTRWADGQVMAAQCRGWMETGLGWRLDATRTSNPRTLRNWQMQSTGSEMLQSTVVLLAVTHSIRICATMHDAILVELPLETWRDDLDMVRHVMAEVSKALIGLEIRTDERVMMPGERYLTELDEEWERWRRVVAWRPQPKQERQLQHELQAGVQAVVQAAI